MKEQNLPLKQKPKYFKRFWWVWIVLGIGILSFAVVTYNAIKHDQSQPKTKEGTVISTGKDRQGRGFTDAELAAADKALANGIRIEDPQNDWYRFPPGSMQPDGRPDNSNPYPLGWTDFRSVSVGADENYLYFKFQFWDIFPQKVMPINGDLIHSMGAKIESLSFINNEDKIDTADLGSGIWYVEMQNETWVPADQGILGHDAMISPTGRDELQETIFKMLTSAGMVAGGPGFDYIFSAYPLSLFNLKSGDEITFHSSTETGSTVFHHEALDVLLDKPNSKFGETIKYRLGSNHYEIVPNVEEKNFS